MVQKRPGEGLDDFSFKQPRYSEPGDQTVSNLDAVDQNASEVHHYLGDDEVFPAKVKHHFNGRLNSDISEADKEIGTTSLHGALGNSSCSWITSEENIGSESAFRILLSPDYYNAEDHVSIIVHPRVLYYSLLDIPQQKIVPIGIDFQAELPESGDAFVDVLLNKYNKLIGTCVIPMPELEVGGNGEKPAGSGRTQCFCEDIGSIRCVKQHVEESRVLLRISVGIETFCNLGLDDMGEVVAEKWSKEENKIFHEVIFSNLESLGINFWDHLVNVFPFRTKKEIVSYYFNVFMLRKRAEQNRCSNLLDIDSDNDELETVDEVPEKMNKEDGYINPSRFVLYDENEIYTPSDRGDLDDVQNGFSDICSKGEVNGPGVETGTCNTRIDGEQRDPDCENSLFTMYDNGGHVDVT